MILVDSSIWIDQLADRDTLEIRAFEKLLADKQNIGVGDLVMVEVLQGTRDERAFRMASAHLAGFAPVQISDSVVAEAAARHFRSLRAKGITVRKKVDLLIATRCILDGHDLLYRDRDFDPFVEHFGLRPAVRLAFGSR